MTKNTKWPLMKNTISIKDRARLIRFILGTDQFTNGPKVREFEEVWNNWLGSKYSLYVSSGSTADLLLVAAIKEKYKLKAGDKVLVPACTWVTNISPIIQLGLQPVFCDINFSNFSFDNNALDYIKEQHPDIKVIFVTHLLGLPADKDYYQKMFPDAVIIDDVCESHGVKYLGNKVGSDSIGATFSFYFGHHMTTIEGGMVSTNDYELYDLMKMKRSHGMSRESVQREFYESQYPNIDKSFLFITDGYNFRNHEIGAVLGLSQLKRLDDMINIRKVNYFEFYNMMGKHAELFYLPEYYHGNSSFCFPIIARNSSTKKKLVNHLIENGIEYRPIVSGNLLSQPFLRDYRICSPHKQNNVDILQSNGLYLGNSHFVGLKEIKMLDRILTELEGELL